MRRSIAAEVNSLCAEADRVCEARAGELAEKWDEATLAAYRSGILAYRLAIRGQVIDNDRYFSEIQTAE